MFLWQPRFTRQPNRGFVFCGSPHLRCGGVWPQTKHPLIDTKRNNILHRWSIYCGCNSIWYIMIKCLDRRSYFYVKSWGSLHARAVVELEQIRRGCAYLVGARLCDMWMQIRWKFSSYYYFFFFSGCSRTQSFDYRSTHAREGVLNYKWTVRFELKYPRIFSCNI